MDKLFTSTSFTVLKYFYFVYEIQRPKVKNKTVFLRVKYKKAPYVEDFQGYII